MVTQKKEKYDNEYVLLSEEEMENLYEKIRIADKIRKRKFKIIRIREQLLGVNE